MPVTASGKWYQGLSSFSGAVVAPKIYGTTTTETAFSTEDALGLELSVGAFSFLRTALAGANNDLDYVAKTPGDLSALQIRYVDPSANNASLSVAYTTNLITVNLATGVAGAITSTASTILAAINAADSAAAPYVTAALAPSNTGAGVVIALAATSLVNSSGTSPTADVTMTYSVDGTTDFYNVLTIPQFTTARVYYKRVTSPLSPNGTGLTKYTVTVGGSATPLLAIGVAAKKIGSLN